MDAKKKPKWRKILRYGLYTVLVLAVLLTAFVYYLLNHHVASPYYVQCSGNSGTMGLQYGSQLKTPMQLLLTYYVNDTLCFGNKKVIEKAYTKGQKTAATFPLVYQEELKTMSQASNCDYNGLAYANCFLDLGRANVGCRSIVAITGQSVFHCHNLDWDSLSGLARWVTCIVRRSPSDGRFRTVSVGFPGMIGALDIVNDKGIALSFNQLGTSKGTVTEPVFIMMRRIAETCDSFAKAKQEIINCKSGMPFIITLSSATENKAAIFERMYGAVTERKASPLASACNRVQGEISGDSRLDILLAETKPQSATDLQKVLGNDEILMGGNIYSVIFDFNNNLFYLASGKIPAAKQTYHKHVLFE